MFSITGLIILCLIYHTTYVLPDTQIIGGTDASDGQYPYQVSLKRSFNGNHICGGVIISQKYVITAAHCLENLRPIDILIDVGSTNLQHPEGRYGANSLILHPRYNKELLVNDIALIKIFKNITFSKNTKSLNLISYNDDFKNVDFTVTGWGMISNGSMPNRLQQIVVRAFPQEACVEALKGIKSVKMITNNHICTLQAWGKGTCNGDSGSALTYKGALVGIVSFGVPCAIGYPDVYTRVYPYRDWINEYVNTGNNQQSNIILGLFMTYLCIHSFL